jgi:lipopolysaccharide transport protein LptA
MNSSAVEVTAKEGFHIKADAMSADLKHGIILHTGNVAVTHADMSFLADSSQDFRNNKILTKITSHGNSAVFIHKLGSAGNVSKGTVKEILYIAPEAKIYLKGYSLEDFTGNISASK